MISPRDHEPGFRNLRRHEVESLHHQLETFISSPFAKGKNAVLGISAPPKLGELRPARENSVRPQMHIVTPILIVQNLAIARH